MAAQSQVIECKPREQLGTRKTRRLRQSGMIPAVIHGGQAAPEAVALAEHEIELALKHGQRVLDLKLKDEAAKVLIKQVQYDHLGTTPIHLDLRRVSLSDRVKVTVPLEFRGTPVGTKDGGVLQTLIVELEIEVLVTEIPERIRVNVGDLKIDDVIHVRDIQVPPGVKVLSKPDDLVALVTTIAEELPTAAPAEGEAAEPEVIGRVREPEEEGEEAEAKKETKKEE